MSKGERNYRSRLRAAVYGFWRGAIDQAQFERVMTIAVSEGQRQAFAEGARECGILPSEFSIKEEMRIYNAILYELQWLPGLTKAIEQNSKKNGGKVGPLYSRIDIWIGRYNGLRSEARAMACQDKKLKWVQGPTSDGCSSCSKLNGKVRRASWWYQNSILPRVHGAPYLECKGFHCLCELVPTDDPCTPGPMPRLP